MIILNRRQVYLLRWELTSRAVPPARVRKGGVKRFQMNGLDPGLLWRKFWERPGGGLLWKAHAKA